MCLACCAAKGGGGRGGDTVKEDQQSNTSAVSFCLLWGVRTLTNFELHKVTFSFNNFFKNL